MPTAHRRAWMRAYQAKCRAAALKAQVVALLRAGVPPERIGKPETLRQRIRWLLRDRDALKARIEWQSGGIRMLRDQLATLQARFDTLPAMQERELSAQIGHLNTQLLWAQQRITLLEAESATIPMLVITEPAWATPVGAEAILDDQRLDLLEEEGVS